MPLHEKYDRTIYELSWSDLTTAQTQVRFFDVDRMNDAAVRFAERVIELDRAPPLSAAWVRLRRLPDSIYSGGMDLIAWTKTSDERLTAEGVRSIAELRARLIIAPQSEIP